MKMNKITEMSSPELEKELGELKTELSILSDVTVPIITLRRFLSIF